MNKMRVVVTARRIRHIRQRIYTMILNDRGKSFADLAAINAGDR